MSVIDHPAGSDGAEDFDQHEDAPNDSSPLVDDPWPGTNGNDLFDELLATDDEWPMR